MNRTTIGLAVLAAALVAAGCSPEYSGYRYRERHAVRDSLTLMTKADVIALSRSKIGDNIIISMINNSGSTFQLRTPDVIELADSGVSDTVISAMMNAGEREGGGAEGGRYYGMYPQYYGWAGYPWWSPWYFSGYWGGWYRPYSFYRVHAPVYYGGVRYRTYGAGAGTGVRRALGRRR